MLAVRPDLTVRRQVGRLYASFFDIPSGSVPGGPVATGGRVRCPQRAALRWKCDKSPPPPQTRLQRAIPPERRKPRTRGRTQLRMTLTVKSPISKLKSGIRRLRCVAIHVACLLIMFFNGRLAMPTVDMKMRDTPLFFFAPGVSMFKRPARKKRK